MSIQTIIILYMMAIANDGLLGVNSRKKNYKFKFNATLIARDIREKQQSVVYYTSYEKWSDTYIHHIYHILTSELQSKTCLVFIPQRDMNRDPPRLAVQSPYILLRRSSKPNRCYIDRHGQFMQIYLHEKWCLSPFKIITAFLEALGMSSENLINRLDRQIYEDDAVKNILKFIDPRPEFQLVYERMPINLVKVSELIAYCYLAMKTDIDDLRSTGLTFRTLKMLNNMYCIRRCDMVVECENGGTPDTKTCTKCTCPDGFTGPKCELIMLQTGKMATELCGDNKRKVAPVNMSQTLDYYFPNVMSDLHASQNCQWLITAPEGIHISLHIYSSPPFYYNCSRDFVCRDYLEVRTASDLSLDGFRFCCYEFMPIKLKSESNKILIISRISNPGSTPFYPIFTSPTERPKKTRQQVELEYTAEKARLNRMLNKMSPGIFRDKFAEQLVKLDRDFKNYDSD